MCVSSRRQAARINQAQRAMPDSASASNMRPSAHLHQSVPLQTSREPAQALDLSRTLAELTAETIPARKRGRPRRVIVQCQALSFEDVASAVRAIPADDRPAARDRATQAAQSAGLSGSEWAVHAYLLREIRWDRGCCFASNMDLARAIRMSKEAVKVAVRKLKRAGIVVDKRAPIAMERRHSLAKYYTVPGLLRVGTQKTAEGDLIDPRVGNKNTPPLGNNNCPQPMSTSCEKKSPLPPKGATTLDLRSEKEKDARQSKRSQGKRFDMQRFLEGLGLSASQMSLIDAMRSLMPGRVDREAWARTMAEEVAKLDDTAAAEAREALLASEPIFWPNVPDLRVWTARRSSSAERSTALTSQIGSLSARQAETEQKMAGIDAALQDLETDVQVADKKAAEIVAKAIERATAESDAYRVAATAACEAYRADPTMTLPDLTEPKLPPFLERDRKGGFRRRFDHTLGDVLRSSGEDSGADLLARKSALETERTSLVRDQSTIRQRIDTALHEQSMCANVRWPVRKIERSAGDGR